MYRDLDSEARGPRHLRPLRTLDRVRVDELACDPPGLHREIEEWDERYRDTVTTTYATNRRSLMAAACSKFYTAVVNEQLSHDGDPRWLATSRTRS